jgi:hypothetical protein
MIRMTQEKSRTQNAPLNANFGKYLGFPEVHECSIYAGILCYSQGPKIQE